MPISSGTLVKCLDCGWRHFTSDASSLDRYFCEACGKNMPHERVVITPKGGEDMKKVSRRMGVVLAVAAVAVVLYRRAMK